MKRTLPLTFMLFFYQSVSADATCINDIKADICVAVHSTELDCNNASSSNYLSHCVATVTYDVTNNSNSDVEAKASCNVEINYLQSVMGIRAIGQERNVQRHNLLATTSNRFTMPVEFSFSTQTEANNADIKGVTCRIEPASY